MLIYHLFPVSWVEAVNLTGVPQHGLLTPLMSSDSTIETRHAGRVRNNAESEIITDHATFYRTT